jgi:hypothetical protein
MRIEKPKGILALSGTGIAISWQALLQIFRGSVSLSR